MTPPRIHITWAVLEAAKDAGDEMVIAACRRIIVAERVGWRRHGNPADLRLVYSFAEAPGTPRAWRGPAATRPGSWSTNTVCTRNIRSYSKKCAGDHASGGPPGCQPRGGIRRFCRHTGHGAIGALIMPGSAAGRHYRDLIIALPVIPICIFLYGLQRPRSQRPPG